MARIPDEQIERLKREVSLGRLVQAQGIELKPCRLEGVLRRHYGLQ